MNNLDIHNESNWLNEILEEVGLQQFYPKLTNDLQLTKLSHFDFVSEEDLIQLGLSKPAAKRLLAAIKKRKSFVTALKNRIVNKLIPNSSSINNTPSSTKNKTPTDLFTWSTSNGTTPTATESGDSKSDPQSSRLTCLIKSKDIQIKEDIGHGVHGFVKKGEWKTPNGRVVEVALKILRQDVRAEPGASFNDFVKEISVMHLLDHPNIIKLYGIVLSSPMMMVTELAPFGNLRDKLRKENGHTPISQLINFAVQIASGMGYLESKRFVHRDLAARNIFISHGKKILIGDLGLMRAIPTQENHYIMSEKTKIPYPWCAPESLRSKQFSSSSDVYMFGVTLWEMFSFGKEPWAGLNLNEILDNISSETKRLPCPDACPAMVYQTLLQCWNIDPNRRPNFSTLHAYLSTSYALEVVSTQHISEIGHKRVDGKLVSDEWSESYSNSSSEDSKDRNRKVMTCFVDDRILVIDGEPEKYWWKGQNQRTFEIGWFPLCSTRWLKKGPLLVSQPLKNSFVHCGHCGKDGRWGNPKCIDHMYLKNPLQPEDINSFNAMKLPSNRIRNGILPKNKTKLKLSRFFGIHDNTTATSHATQLVNYSYQKFSNEPTLQTPKAINHDFFARSFSITHSDESIKQTADDPPLIDLSDDSPLAKPEDTSSTSTTNLNTSTKLTMKQESLIDMDASFPLTTMNNALQRRVSETNLNQSEDFANYHLSWAGSWNTGTFDGSNGNIYSAYYCPQDAAVSSSNGGNGQLDNGQIDAINSRYYSAVAQDDDH